MTNEDVHWLSRELRARYRVSDRTIDRWLASETLGFPRPLVINGRRYWVRESILAWERERNEQKASA